MKKSSKLSFLFVGSHADDIEIGCGGTVAKFRSLGYHVDIIVLTDMKDDPEIRRNEARAGAKELGVGKENVYFLGEPDGHLEANANTISKMRKLIKDNKIKPNGVFIHSLNDSHNDHRAAHSLCLGAFRHQTFFTYEIVNSRIESATNHALWVDITSFGDKKLAALNQHVSQLNAKRLLFEGIESYSNKEYVRGVEGNYYETYSVIMQHGSNYSFEIMQSISDNLVANFYYYLTRGESLAHIEGVLYHSPNDMSFYVNESRRGLSILRENLESHGVVLPEINEFNCQSTDAQMVVKREHVIISGGSDLNTISRDYFDHFEHLKYIIDYKMPGYTKICIYCPHGDKRYFAKYVETKAGARSVATDYGLLTIMKNPVADYERILVGCMGVHGYGSAACYQFLTQPEGVNQIMMQTKGRLFEDYLGIQLLLEVDVATNHVTVIDSYLIPEEPSESCDDVIKAVRLAGSFRKE